MLRIRLHVSTRQAQYLPHLARGKYVYVHTNLEVVKKLLAAERNMDINDYQNLRTFLMFIRETAEQA